MSTNLQLIKSTKSTDLVSNVSLQNVFSSQYKEYELHITFHNASTNGGYGGLRFFDSSDTIIDGTEYAYAGSHLKDNGSFDNSWIDTDATFLAPLYLDANDDSRGGGCVVKIFNPNSSSDYTYVVVESATYGDGGLMGAKTLGHHLGAETITGVQILNVSSTRSLNVVLYGVL